MRKKTSITMGVAIATILATSAFAFALTNKAIAQGFLFGKFPPEINSAIQGKVLAGQQPQAGNVLAGDLLGHRISVIIIPLPQHKG